MSARKLFSVVLPVRNGGEQLKLCVASILAQTLAEDFDLLILENGSTDGTSEWLTSLRDPRVRLYRAERPLSIEQNWARIKDLPKNEFLTIIGHDDLLDPTFLKVVAQLIREHPEARLYSTHFRIIDEQGAFSRRCRPIPWQETAAEFVAARLANLRDSFGTGQVMRADIYDAVGGIPPFRKLLYADDALFLQAIGKSYRATALEEAFSYRWHSQNTSANCSRGDLFQGLEQYAKLLGTLRGQDPALAEVLRRYFPAYAIQEGLLWKHEALLKAYRTHTTIDPELDQRVRELAGSFGGETDLTTITTPATTRLLEYATHSRLGGALYATFEIVQKSLEPARQLFARALHAVGASKR